MARPPGLLNEIAFGPFWWIFRLFLAVWFRLRVDNPPRLRGAYVVAPNHTSLLDPLLVGGASRRRIVFLMTEPIYRSPWTGWFYRWNKAIPVAVGGGNRDALRAARSVLRQGRVVGIFPEGGLSRDGGLLLGSPGAVSLVLQEKVAVVPIGVIGAYRALPAHGSLPRPTKIIVRFGDPITPEELAAAGTSRKDRLAAATRLIMDRIGALMGQLSREAELEASRASGTEPAKPGPKG